MFTFLPIGAAYVRIAPEAWYTVLGVGGFFMLAFLVTLAVCFVLRAAKRTANAAITTASDERVKLQKEVFEKVKNSLEVKLAAAETGLTKANAEKERLAADIKTANAAITTASAERVKLQNELKEAKEVLTAASEPEEVERLQKDLNQANESITAASDERKQLQKDLETAKSAAGKAELALANAPKLEELEEARKASAVSPGAVEKLQSELKIAHEAKNKAEQRANQAIADYDAGEREFNDLEEKIGKLFGRLRSQDDRIGAAITRVELTELKNEQGKIINELGALKNLLSEAIERLPKRKFKPAESKNGGGSPSKKEAGRKSRQIVGDSKTDSAADAPVADVNAARQVLVDKLQTRKEPEKSEKPKANGKPPAPASQPATQPTPVSTVPATPTVAK